MKSVQQAAYALLALVLGALVAKEGSFIFVPLVWGIFFAMFVGVVGVFLGSCSRVFRRRRRKHQQIFSLALSLFGF
jgi:hypothetical protein